MLLRRLSVRQRILGSFLFLLLLFLVTLPVWIRGEQDLLARQRTLLERTVQGERLILQAAASIAASRANVLRYLQDFTPSPYEALEDVDLALTRLQTAQLLFDNPAQRTRVTQLLEALQVYRAQIEELQRVRSEGDMQALARLQFEVLRRGPELNLEAAAIVERSQAETEAATQQLEVLSQQRLALITGGYVLVFAVVFWMSWRIQESLTRPIAELRDAAEAFSQGRWETRLSVQGQDELSRLMQAFNTMAEQLQQLYRELETRVELRTAELAQRARELEAAARVAREATTFRGVEDLLTSIVGLIAEAFAYDHVSVYLMDEQGRNLILSAASSEAGKALVRSGFQQKVGEGVVGTAAKTGLPRIVSDVHNDPDYLSLPGLGAVQSEVAIPMKVGERVVGVLDLESYRPQAFPAASVTIMQTLADQITLALENARLLSASQQAVEELQRLYSEQAREAWARLIAGGVSAYRYTGVEVVPLVDERETGRDKRRLELPLKLRGQVLGTIVLERPLQQPAWTEDERLIAEAIAEQAALALDNARLIAETRARAARESLTAEIAARLRASLDIEKVLQTAVLDFGRALGAMEVNIRLVEQEEEA